MEQGRGGKGRKQTHPRDSPGKKGPPGGLPGSAGGGELGPYLVSSGRIGAGVSPQGRELLLQAVVGAVAEAVGDPRRCQDPGDAGEGQEGEEEEFRGLCLFPALRQRRDVAFLQGRRERQRLSCAVTEQRGGGGSRRGEHTGALTFRRGGRQIAGQGENRCRAPLRALPSGGSHLTTERRRRRRWVRAGTAERPTAPRPARTASRATGCEGRSKGKSGIVFSLVKNKPQEKKKSRWRSFLLSVVEGSGLKKPPIVPNSSRLLLFLQQ